MQNKKQRKINKRALSRLMAVQIFYQKDFLSDAKKIDEIKDDVIENYALTFEDEVTSYRQEIDEDFLNELVSGVALAAASIDEEIRAQLKNQNDISALDSVLVQILRCAVFELKFYPSKPSKALISEYVDIAAAFLPSKKIGFVNGMLENLSKKLQTKNE